MNKNIILIIFCIGISLTSMFAAKVSTEGQRFPDTWPLFFVLALISVGSVIYWRKRVKDESLGGGLQKTDSTKDPVALIKLTLEQVEKINYKNLNCDQVRTAIDQILLDIVNPLTENRMKMLLIYGQQKGADILVTFSYGERMLNRIWSAAADNCKEEVNAVFPEAIDALKQSVAKL